MCEGRTPEGYLSAAHLISVTITVILFFGVAILCSFLFKKDAKKQNLFLLISGIGLVVIYIIELISVALISLHYKNNVAMDLFNNLPLFLCDLSIIITPLAALTKGRFREFV